VCGNIEAVIVIVKDGSSLGNGQITL